MRLALRLGCRTGGDLSCFGDLRCSLCSSICGFIRLDRSPGRHTGGLCGLLGGLGHPIGGFLRLDHGLGRHTGGLCGLLGGHGGLTRRFLPFGHSLHGSSHFGHDGRDVCRFQPSLRGVDRERSRYCPLCVFAPVVSTNCRLFNVWRNQHVLGTVKAVVVADAVVVSRSDNTCIDGRRGMNLRSGVIIYCRRNVSNGRGHVEIGDGTTSFWSLPAIASDSVTKGATGIALALRAP